MIAPELFFQPGNSALDPRVIVSCEQIVPNEDGSYRAPYAKVAGGIDSKGYTATAAWSAFLGVSSSGARRLFLGAGVETAASYFSEIYAVDASGTTWSTAKNASSVIASSLLDHSGWHFCQYENQTIACCLTFATQTATTGNFSDLSNAPRCKVVDTLNDALWAWNVHSGGTHYPDELWISDVGDPTDWTPVTDGSSLAFKTQLTDCPGPGTAMIRYRNFMVIFKRRGMWIGQYTRDDQIYDVSLYSANVGCIGKDACIVAEDRLYFADDQNVYEFDGANIRSICDPSYITKTLIQTILDPDTGTGQDASRTQLHYDDLNKVLTVYARDGVRPQPAFTYNLISQKWGKIDAGSTYADSLLCVLNAPADDLIAFRNLGVTASSNENRVNFAGTTFPSGSFRNGHNSDTAGQAVTAYFGSSFQAQTLRQIFFNSDDEGGVSVIAQARRSPHAQGTVQKTTSSATVSADMLADLMCDGNFFKLSWNWNAQTNATPATFTKWRGYECGFIRSGRR